MNADEKRSGCGMTFDPGPKPSCRISLLHPQTDTEISVVCFDRFWGAGMMMMMMMMTTMKRVLSLPVWGVGEGWYTSDRGTCRAVRSGSSALVLPPSLT